MIRAEAWAKVNLTLRITGRRMDGYHLLSSIFAKINLKDDISFTPSARNVTLTCSDPSIPADGRNLAVRAAMALRGKMDMENGVAMDLIKRIPVAAGLGGGSSDAAATLAVLNRMWGVNLPEEELAEMALKLGADVPFFQNGAMAHVEGIGEKITPLAPQKPIPVLLANPGFGIRAQDAYKGSIFDFRPVENLEGLISAATSGDPARLATFITNDLEPWAMGKYPALAALRMAMERTEPAPLAVAMSGSGPTMFAIHSTAERMEAAAKGLAGAAPFVYPAMTLV